MSEKKPGIVILEHPIDPAELRRLVDLYFGNMVKFVVDVRRRRAAVGGELQTDGEAELLARGSAQADLWGANYYPGLGPEECIEYSSLINIRPSQGNRGMEIGDEEVRKTVREITHALIGRGEELP